MEEEKNKSYFTISKAIVIMLIILTLLLAAIIGYSKEEEIINYTILLRDCDINEGNCYENSTIEKDNLTFGDNWTVSKYNLDDEFLSYWCTQLDDNNWGCGKQLVKKLVD